MRKSIVKAVCFLLLLAALLACYTRVYSFKHVDGIAGLQSFYRQDGPINDVIFVGSSNVFEDINTGVLWDEYGIAAFDLAGSVQPVWNSYYYIKEALKTQSPRLIVLEVMGVLQSADYIDASRIIKNTYGMRLSPDKIEAVRVSAPPEEQTNYLWEIPTYHMRYSELGPGDFRADRDFPGWGTGGIFKGFLINTDTVPCEKPEGFQTDEASQISAKAEQYLREICRLCRERGVELLFIKSPGVTSRNATMKYNRAAEIGAEYGVPFVNFNLSYDEIGLDFSTDLGDPSHLNYRGNVKYTRYLAEYLRARYDLPDRRGEAGYESYDAMALDCAARTRSAYLCDTEALGAYLALIREGDYVVSCAVRGDLAALENYEDVKALLASAGAVLRPDGAPAVWVLRGGGVLFSSAAGDGDSWHTELAPHRSLQAGIAEGGTPSIVYNRAEQVGEGEGITLAVYDPVTQSLADTAVFPITGGVLQSRQPA